MKIFPSSSWWKRALGFLVYFVVAVITILVLVASVISWQGRRDWKQTKDTLEARGEDLGFASLIPAAVPDEVNFFADPLWMVLLEKVPAGEPEVRLSMGKFSPEEFAALRAVAPALVDRDAESGKMTLLARAWNKSRGESAAQRDELARLTLAVLAPRQATMERIVFLLQRPAAHFPVNYEAGYAASLPHVGGLMALGQAFSLRGRAEVQSGEHALAQRDLLTALALPRTLGNEPFLISLLVRRAALSTAMPLLDDGTRRHFWTEQDLVLISAALGREEFMPDLARSLRAERGVLNQFLDSDADPTVLVEMMQMMQMLQMLQTNGWARPKQPQQWLLKQALGAYKVVFGPADRAYANRVLQERIDAVEKGSRSATAKRDFLAEDPKEGTMTFRRTHLFSSLTLPDTVRPLSMMAQGEDMLVQARTVCALERYYLAQGEYPARLEELVPDYLAAVPHEVLTLKPMAYERAAEGAFRLWSSGWNETDDQGRPAFKATEEGDWVWGAVR